MNGKYSITLAITNNALHYYGHAPSVILTASYKETEKQQNLFNQSNMVHITPLVIHALRGARTHARAHTHTHTHTHTHKQTLFGKSI